MKFKTCSISPRIFYLKHRTMVMKQTGEIYIQPKTKIKQNKTNKQTKQTKHKQTRHVYCRNNCVYYNTFV